MKYEKMRGGKMEKIKIFLVDDEAIILKGLETTYSWDKMGAVVAGTSRNPRKAVDEILEKRPDIVITDIRMKQMSGLDLIQDVQTAQAVVQLQANPENVKTNDDRVAYLESCGWLVGEEAANQEDIRLPDVFDDSYEAYLTLQESQGFDLTQYAGKTIQRYTYAVKNFPGLQENIWASLLLYQDQVIGGEVYSNQGDGFMQGLAYPAKQ